MLASIALLLAASGPLCPDQTANAAELCADVAVARAWQDTIAAYDVLAAANPQSATISGERAELEAAFRQGFSYPLKDSPLSAASADAIVSELQNRSEEVRGEARLIASIDAGSNFATDLPAKCLVRAMFGCKVVAAGYLNSDNLLLEGGSPNRRIGWQSVIGRSAPDGYSIAMTLVWEMQGNHPYYIGHALSDGTMFPPRLIDNGEQVLLHLPGRTSGTGEGNADALFVVRDGKWAQINMDSWKDELPAKLPNGLGLWKGVEYDYYGLSSYFPLWRASDPNCCASGGNAYASFKIDGNKLLIDSIDVQKSADVQISAPQCAITEAVYSLPANSDFKLRFVKARYAPSAASDLLMELTRDASEPDTTSFTRYYAFAGAQGFGGTSLIPVDGIGSDDGPPEPTIDMDSDEPSDKFFAFTGMGAAMTLNPSPPQVDDMAPVALFLYDLSQSLWYGGYFPDGQKLPERVLMPTDLWVGECVEADAAQ